MKEIAEYGTPCRVVLLFYLRDSGFFLIVLEHFYGDNNSLPAQLIRIK